MPNLVPVIEGLYSYLTGDSTFNTAIGGSASSAGRLYYSLAPKGTSFPYATFQVISNTDALAPMAQEAYSSTIQISIFETYEAGPRACLDINDKLRARLNRETFSITGATMMAATMAIERGPMHVDESYMQAVDYLVRGFAA